MQPSMSFKFTPTNEDYIKTLRAAAFSPSSLGTRFLIYFFAFALILLGYFFLGSSLAPLWWVILVIVIIALFFQFVVTPMNIRQQVQNHERLRSEITWTVDETGVRLATKFGESKNDWGTFQRFTETQSHILLYYSTNPRVFQLVPKRVFETPEQLASFRQILTANLAKAHSQVVEPPWLVRNRWKILTYILLAVIFSIIVVVTAYTNSHGLR
jgi:hypothetical protein